MSLTLDGHDANRVTGASPFVCAATGWNHDDLIGSVAADIVDAATLQLVELCAPSTRFEQVNVGLRGPAGEFVTLPGRVTWVAGAFGTVLISFDSSDPESGEKVRAETYDAGEIISSSGSLVHASSAATRLLEAAGQHELVDEPAARFFPDGDRRLLDRLAIALHAQPGARAYVDVRLRTIAGQSLLVRARVSAAQWNGGPATLIEFGQAREPIAPDRRRSVEDAVSEAIISTDARFVVETWNRSAERLYGWSAAEAVGRTIQELIGGETDSTESSTAADELFRTGEWSGAAVQRHRNGAPVHVRAFTRLLRDAYGSVVGVISVNTAQAAPILPVDLLTDAATRAVLFDHLGQAVPDESWVVVLLDLDSFSSINSRFGVGAGDNVLVSFTQRLRAASRPGDLLARVGADRFAVCGPVADDSATRSLVAALAATTAEPFTLDGTDVHITASAGVASGTSEEGMLLFDFAERALRAATANGGKQVRFFDSTLVAGPWDDEARFADDVQRGLAAGEFSVVYQPIVDARDTSLLKVEALARWTHPRLGSVSPVDFIPLAERTGTISEIGAFVLRTAAAAVQAELDAGVELTVNVSVKQLRDPAFPEMVLAVLHETGLPASRLWIEVTESVLIDQATTEPLERLHEAGLRLVIDDFGTGYSSLQYISRLPVEAIKIDRAFVSGLGIDARDTAIVRSVVNLGDELGVEVIAEGVETAAQAQHLATLNCHLAQGWLYGRPESIETIASHSRAAPVRKSTLRHISDTEELRLRALAATGILDTPPEPEFDSLTALAARLFDTPISLVSLVDRDRQWFKSRVGLEATETPRNIAFCSYAIERPSEVFVVSDASFDGRFSDNPLVTGPPNIRFYAGAPIVSRENLGLGTLCVIDTKPRTLTADETSLLQALAAQAAAMLELRRRNLELTARLRDDAAAASPTTAILDSAVLHHSADVLVVLDAAGTITFASDSLRAVLGHEPLLWVGRSALELVHPLDLDLAERIVNVAAHVSGLHHPFVLRLRRADGSWCEMEMMARTVVGDPRVNGVVISARDVSGRDQIAADRDQRRFLDVALDIVSEGVIACDAGGVLTEFNLAARRLHGQPGRALPASEWAASYNLRTADGKRQLRLEEVPLYRALQGEHVVDTEIQIAPPGEPPRRVRCTGQPLRADHDVIVGAVLTLREVSSGWQPDRGGRDESVGVSARLRP